ncbi:hypothetical protein [Nesterenkonia sphaerica]|uniref:hypothetical protein n=1 Tax=Nesterenkonia sphaerica TaxID=1804988 RepID=UPI0014083A82|nr:hypothetical protein [Nesterenkonia sphaerica]
MSPDTSSRPADGSATSLAEEERPDAAAVEVAGQTAEHPAPQTPAENPPENPPENSGSVDSPRAEAQPEGSASAPPAVPEADADAVAVAVAVADDDETSDADSGDAESGEAHSGETDSGDPGTESPDADSTEADSTEPDNAESDNSESLNSEQPQGSDGAEEPAQETPPPSPPEGSSPAEAPPAEGDSAQSPPARPGIAPARAVPAGPDKSLGGFLDTLDERAKNWWANRKVRHARRKAEAARAAAEVPETPAAGTSARHARRSGGQLPVPAPQVSLPKPPPAEQRPEPQLFTDAIPVVPAEETTVLPPYWDEPQAPPPPAARRELDEQRKRTVIAQKAAAIEKATAQDSPRPYGGSGSIGGQYRHEAAAFADDEEDLYTYIPPYNLPSRSPDPEPTQWDLARRIFVSLGAVAAVLSTMWMFGWFGSSEENPAILGQRGLQEAQAGGWYSGEQALLSPDYNWYWLWPAITIGLIIHACYQWRPAQHSTPRQQRSGWLIGTAAMLMWVVTASLYAGLFTLNLLSSLAIAAALTEAVRQFNLYTARNDTERKLTDDIVGLFYGFALVQVMSALSVWLTQLGWHIPGIPAPLWATIGLLICVWTAAFYSMTERGRITIALSLAWGLFWLIFPRILGEVTSVWVALGAAMGAFIVILCTQSRRYRINHAERRAAMGRPLEDII